MKKIWLTANFFGLLVLTSGSVNSAEQTLEHMYWRTTSIGEEAISVPPQQIPHVAFHAEESRVAGFGGCNRFFASYEQNEEKITISIIFYASFPSPIKRFFIFSTFINNTCLMFVE